MGKLYDARQKIEQAIKEKNLDPVNTSGEITLKTGFLLAFISPSTPDNETKYQELKKAAKEILNIEI